MNRIKELRKKEKLTTTALGKAVGCSNQAITNYELGNRKPDPDMLIKLADYFDVSIDYLLGRQQPSISFEWTDEEKALGVGRHATYLSEEEIEWLELRSEVLRVRGEDYLKTLITMIAAVIKEKH